MAFLTLPDSALDLADLQKMFLAASPDQVIKGFGVSVLTPTSVRVAAGEAVAGGWPIENTQNADFANDLNSSGTDRLDKLVVRTTFPSQPAPPAQPNYPTWALARTSSGLTQVKGPGNAWEMPLAQWTTRPGESIIRNLAVIAPRRGAIREHNYFGNAAPNVCGIGNTQINPLVYYPVGASGYSSESPQFASIIGGGAVPAGVWLQLPASGVYSLRARFVYPSEQPIGTYEFRVRVQGSGELLGGLPSVAYGETVITVSDWRPRAGNFNDTLVFDVVNRSNGNITVSFGLDVTLLQRPSA